MAQFASTLYPHESHEWRRVGFAGSDEQLCNRCEICTCHSSVASTEPCDNPAWKASWS